MPRTPDNREHKLWACVSARVGHNRVSAKTHDTFGLGVERRPGECAYLSGLSGCKLALLGSVIGLGRCWASGYNRIGGPACNNDLVIITPPARSPPLRSPAPHPLQDRLTRRSQ